MVIVSIVEGDFVIPGCNYRTGGRGGGDGKKGGQGRGIWGLATRNLKTSENTHTAKLDLPSLIRGDVYDPARTIQTSHDRGCGRGPPWGLGAWESIRTR